MTARAEALGSSTRLSAFIQRNALVVYFGVAFFISWVFWCIEPAVRPQDPITAGLLIQIGVYGPVLAAMLVASISDRERVRAPLWLRLLAGGAVLALAVYANWILIGQMRAASFQPVHWVLLAVILLLPAWVFFNAHSSLRGVQNLLKSLTQVRTNPLWFVIALLLMLTVSVIGVFATSLITGQALSSWVKAFQNRPIMQNLALTFIATALYGGPVGEEAGWRGFALPRLQKRFDPLLASVILGALWALWHLPLHVTGYYNQAYGDPMTGLLMRAFSTIPLTLIFTWLYNRSKGNLLVMVVLHTMVNVTSGLIAPGLGLYITTTVVVALMVVLDRMYRAKPPASVPGEEPERRSVEWKH